ncbi:MAG: signal recognition particle protein Srp19, partial [Candidatus Altiarchaeota archaeon]|nr:signal recognition particle protein Srp19 [Candidatus Altiarchaeota archaeon]
KEREDPSIIKHERIERIAKGSGCDPSDVRDLLNYYKKMKKMMKGSGGGRRMKALMKQFGM